jgi:TusA-related sulfurtransferase
MADEFKVDLDLDLKGLLCPLPMVRVSQNIG